MARSEPGISEFPVQATRRGASPLPPTPSLSRGPFYPPAPTGIPMRPVRPLSAGDFGSDLTRSHNGGATASGDHIWLDGQVMRPTLEPIGSATVEIWSVNANNLYVAEDGGASDPGFVGFGRTTTAADGVYQFRTIRPQGYERYFGLIRRTAHIHVLVRLPSGRELSTEAWFAGEARNAGDSFAGRLRDPRLQSRMIMPQFGERDGLPTYQFDIVIENRGDF